MNRSRVFAWLAKRSENVAVLLLSLMFGAFILQVVFRYLLNLPSGWAQVALVVGLLETQVIPVILTTSLFRAT